ncbi:MAG: thioredoxin domain-containing protein [bacterium]|nr:thioredoxin domain-containing protein [bacterium]
MIEVSSVEIKWYQTWWGKALAFLTVLVVVALVGLAGLVVKYWWTITHGGGDQLAEQIGLGDTTGKANLLAIRREVEDNKKPYLGSASAPNAIVEFVDFKCPNCKAAAPILHQVLQKYGDKVKLIIRHFPVESTHPGASRLSEVAVCAHEQGNFWWFYDYFYQNQDQIGEVITASDISGWVNAAGLDPFKFNQCLGSGRARIEVNKDYALGVKYNFLGTPTFFVNGVKVGGVPSFQAWDKVLKTL